MIHDTTSQYRAPRTIAFTIFALYQKHAQSPSARSEFGWTALATLDKDPIDLFAMAIGQRITAPYAGPFDPTRFVTSWVLPPSLLFGYRALLALYAFTTLFTIFGWNGTHGRSEESQHSFSFFTNLTYWGLAFYYAFSAAHTGSYWLTGKSFLARWPKVLQVMHSMFYSTIVVYPWIVTSKWVPYRLVLRTRHRR